MLKNKKKQWLLLFGGGTLSFSTLACTINLEQIPDGCLWGGVIITGLILAGMWVLAQKWGWGK